MSTMNIGQAARASGISAKMVRHYEEVGLMPAPARSGGGYRLFAEADVHTLRFVRQARDLGFSLPEIKQLLGLWHDRKRPSRQVKALAQAHIADLERKAHELLAMKATLEHLVHCCRGDDRPDCPILDRLAGKADVAAAAAAARAAPAAKSTRRAAPLPRGRRPRA